MEETEGADNLFEALPKTFRDVEGAKVSIDRVWRWHPRPNEELIIARYVGTSTRPPGKFYHPMVFEVCGDSIKLKSNLRGPVQKMPDPPKVKVETDPQQVVIAVQSAKEKDDVMFRYYYGNVKVSQPWWIKPGRVIDPRDPVRKKPKKKKKK